MSAGFTPGPWELADENNQCCSVLLGTKHNLNCTLDRYDYCTGQLVISREEMLANAHLVAAAPELLEVLKELHESASYWSEYDVPIGMVDRIRSAITKATGETP
jgi:hypothetical protein